VRDKAVSSHVGVAISQGGGRYGPPRNSPRSASKGTSDRDIYRGCRVYVAPLSSLVSERLPSIMPCVAGVIGGGYRMSMRRRYVRKRRGSFLGCSLGREARAVCSFPRRPRDVRCSLRLLSERKLELGLTRKHQQSCLKSRSRQRLCDLSSCSEET
jgi:hypothetical protein